MERCKAETAGSWIVEFDMVSQVELRLKNRRTICNAMVLLGAIPLEDMDVLIHRTFEPPLRQELIVNPEHPYFAQIKLK